MSPIVQIGSGRGLAETAAVVLDHRRQRTIDRAGRAAAEAQKAQAEADRAKADARKAAAEARIAEAEAAEREADAALVLVAVAAAIAAHERRRLDA